MSNTSHFESRSGRVTCTADKVFAFVTDIRNFKQFVPSGTINDWVADRESCSFSVSMIGTVSVRLSQKEKNKRVVFNGDALKKNDFELILNINGNDIIPADVKVDLSAELNPMMKMIAGKPITQFLEMLIAEMEKFRGWDETIE